MVIPSKNMEGHTGRGKWMKVVVSGEWTWGIGRRDP